MLNDTSRRTRPPTPPDAGRFRTGHVVLSLLPQAAGHRVDGGDQMDLGPLLPDPLAPGSGLPRPPVGELVPQVQGPQGIRRRHTSIAVSARYCACNSATVSAVALTTVVVRAMGDFASGDPIDQVPDLNRIGIALKEVLAASGSGVDGYLTADGFKV